jgi:hypothetical protein
MGSFSRGRGIPTESIKKQKGFPAPLPKIADQGGAAGKMAPSPAGFHAGDYQNGAHRGLRGEGRIRILTTKAHKVEEGGYVVVLLFIVLDLKQGIGFGEVLVGGDDGLPTKYAGSPGSGQGGPEEAAAFIVFTGVHGDPQGRALPLPGGKGTVEEEQFGVVVEVGTDVFPFGGQAGGGF